MRAVICIAYEKARKPARSRLSGLSDLHARQVHTAEYYVFNSRVLHTRHSDSTDFHNTTPPGAPLDSNEFFTKRDRLCISIIRARSILATRHPDRMKLGTIEIVVFGINDRFVQ